MFSKYCIADCAGPSNVWTVMTGFSTTYGQKKKGKLITDTKISDIFSTILLGIWHAPWGRHRDWRGWEPCRGRGRCAVPRRTPPRTASPAGTLLPRAPSAAAIAPPRTSAQLQRWQHCQQQIREVAFPHL
jgi:hypothetical protein